MFFILGIIVVVLMLGIGTLGIFFVKGFIWDLDPDHFLPPVEKDTVITLNEVDEFFIKKSAVSVTEETYILNFIIYDRPITSCYIYNSKEKGTFVSEHLNFPGVPLRTDVGFGLMHYKGGKLEIKKEDEEKGFLFSSFNNKSESFDKVLLKLKSLPRTDNVSVTIQSYNDDGALINVGWSPMVRVEDFLNELKRANMILRG